MESRTKDMSGIEWIRAKCVGRALGSLTASGTHKPFGSSARSK